MPMAWMVIDGTCRHALDIGLLDHRGLGLFGHPTRLEVRRWRLHLRSDLELDEIASAAQSDPVRPLGPGTSGWMMGAG
jgi:hypothetical protein